MELFVVGDMEHYRPKWWAAVLLKYMKKIDLTHTWLHSA